MKTLEMNEELCFICLKCGNVRKSKVSTAINFEDSITIIGYNVEIFPECDKCLEEGIENAMMECNDETFAEIVSDLISKGYKVIKQYTPKYEPGMMIFPAIELDGNIGRFKLKENDDGKSVNAPNGFIIQMGPSGNKAIVYNVPEDFLPLLSADVTEQFSTLEEFEKYEATYLHILRDWVDSLAFYA